MKAALYYGVGDIRIEEVPDPEAGPGEIVIRVGADLTCGTDVKTYRRGHPTIIESLPSRFGHEFAGTVVDVGPGVDKFKVGDRVVALNSAPCFECYYCKMGDYSMCENLHMLNGGYAEYLMIPERIVRYNTYPVPDEISFAEAAMTEPLACAVHGIAKSGIQVGDTVAVLGAGPIGLMFVRLAALRGARVISIDPSEERLKAAEEMGASHLVRTPEADEAEREVRALTGGRGADVVVEAVGLPSTWEEALRLVRKSGVVNMFGGAAAGTTITVPTLLLHYNQLTIKGVFHHTPQYALTALNLISNRLVDARRFISGEVGLEELVDVLERHARQEGIKFAVIPS